MNKVLCVLAAALILLTGCSSSVQERGRLTFYYLQKDYLHSSGESVLSGEKRSVVGTMEAILQSYLQGPHSNALISPFPEGIQLEELKLENRCLYIDLGKSLASLTEIRLTLACSALANTCFSLWDIDQVEIRAGGSLLGDQDSITITKDSVLFTDDTTLGEDIS